MTIITNIENWIGSKFSSSKPAITKGDYILKPIGENLWTYFPNKRNPLTLTRSNRQVLILNKQFDTDLASVPILLQNIPWLQRSGMAPACIFHDWLYQIHHTGKDIYSFKESNLVLEEALLGQAKPYKTYTRYQAYTIRRTIDLFGSSVWNKKS